MHPRILFDNNIVEWESTKLLIWDLPFKCKKTIELGLVKKIGCSLTFQVKDSSGPFVIIWIGLHWLYTSIDSIIVVNSYLS